MKLQLIVFTLLLFSQKSVAQYSLKPLDSLQVINRTAINKTLSINSSYQVLGWGFFCKKEWQLEKATKIAFKFRLGSIDACNKYEGKLNY